jgi:hypothetical protein
MEKSRRISDISRIGVGMIESDSEYFRRRAGEERLAATRATHPSARQAHLDLADRYAEAAAAIADSVLSIEATMSPSPAE